MKRITCELCGAEITVCNFSKHMRRHENHPETFDESKYRLNHEGLNCQFCNKLCESRIGLSNHERACGENPNRYTFKPRNGFNNKGRIAWNKGLTKETDERIMAASLRLKGRQLSPPHKHTEETKRKISEARRKYLAEHHK